MRAQCDQGHGRDEDPNKRPRRGFCWHPLRGLSPFRTRPCLSFSMSPRPARHPESLTHPRLSHPSQPLADACTQESKRPPFLRTRTQDAEISSLQAAKPGTSRTRRTGGPPKGRVGISYPGSRAVLCASALPPSLRAANGTSGSAPRDAGPAPGDAPRRRPLPLAQCTAEGGRARGPVATMKLTRKMVLSRAKASELHNVRKLNCW